MARGSSGIKMPTEFEEALNQSFFKRLFVSERKQIAMIADEKSPARISHRNFATKSLRNEDDNESLDCKSDCGRRTDSCFCCNDKKYGRRSAYPSQYESDCDNGTGQTDDRRCNDGNNDEK